MRYAFTRGTKTIVGADESTFEFEAWYTSVRDSKAGFTSTRPTNLVDHLSDLDLKTYKHPAYIFEHANTADQVEFAVNNGINLTSVDVVREMHADMLVVKRGTFGYSDADLEETRSLEKLHGLDDFDKFDKRSDEEKEASKAQKSKMDQMKKRVGEAVTGSSFDPNPMGHDDGTFSVRGISIDANGNVSVSAMKRGGITTPRVSPQNVVEDANGALYIPTGTTADVYDYLATKLADAGFEQDQIDVWRMQLDKVVDPNLEEITATVWSSIWNKQITAAMVPVVGASSVEDAMAEIEKKLNDIDGLTDERRAKLLETAYNNMTAPKPEPGDFKFALNAKLTANPAMRGAGTPVLHIERNKLGPHLGEFSTHEGDPLFDAYGLSCVSDGLYAYEVKTDDAEWTDDICQVLRNAGFIEDQTVQPQPIQPKIGSGKGLTPADFAKALAGDGTSAVDGTDSFGKHKIGKSEADYAADITVGLVGDKGVTLEQDALLRKTTWAKLDEELRKLLEDGLQKAHIDIPTDIMYGPNSAVSVAENTILVMGASDYLIDDACINVRFVGASKIQDGSTAMIIHRDNPIVAGVVVIQAKYSIKVYLLEAKEWNRAF